MNSLEYYPIGTKFMSSGKNKRLCTVSDVLRTYNLDGKLYKLRYIATHEFCGQVITDCDVCTVTIARGLVSL